MARATRTSRENAGMPRSPGNASEISRMNSHGVGNLSQRCRLSGGGLTIRSREQVYGFGTACAIDVAMISVLATAAEAAGEMRGDREVPSPTYETTLAISIDATPDSIWPWLVQIGYRRGGLYSYDWLDRACGYLDAPSATRILPECQRLDAGDAIPMGRGPFFPVAAVDPPRTLVLAGKTDDFQWSWELELRRADAEHTRLISRNRACVPLVRVVHFLPARWSSAGCTDFTSRSRG